MSEKILIVRLAALGDVVMASAVLTRIRAEQPDARVTWACGRGAAELVRLFPGVDEVIALDERQLLAGSALTRAAALPGAWKRIGAGRFDRVLLLHADRRYRALVPTARAAGFRMLERRQGRGLNPIPGRYFGDEYARLLDPHGGGGYVTRRYAPVDVRPNLAHIPRREGSGLVVLVPGGGRNLLRESPTRRWPADRYRALSAALRADGCTVALVGDRHDEWARQYFEGVDVLDRIGRDSLEQTLALMRDADLVISHDTGPMHLTRLVRAPLLALFGPTMPSQFLVPDERTKILWGGADLACRPCYDGREFAACDDNQCMKSLGVDEVLREAETMLGRENRRCLTVL